jgi:DNA-binding HxlR family transcriptional regulator
MADRKRQYHQACGAAHALDILGERWAILVVRELLLGPKRFADIRAGLPGVSANVLSQRLDGLEHSGVLTKRRLPPPASVSIYELTPWGYCAEPILLALAAWGAAASDFTLSRPMSPTTLMLSFRGLFDPARAGKERARVGFRLGSEEFLVLLDSGTLTLERGDPTSADVVFEGLPNQIAQAVYDRADLKSIKIEGDVALAERFIGLFPQRAHAAS